MIRCFRCGRERPRSVNNCGYCDECEQAAREEAFPPETADLRKTGLVAHKDPVTGNLELDIKTWSDGSEWRARLFDALRKLRRIGTLRMRAGEEYVEDLLSSIEGGTAMRVLLLGGTKLTDQGLNRIRMFTALEVLGLSRTQITDDGLSCLVGLTNLSQLFLSETRITSKGLASLRAMPSLQVLDLGGTAVDDTAAVLFEHMPALRRLVLEGTLVTPATVRALGCRRPDLRLDWSPTLTLIGYWSQDRDAAEHVFAPAPGKSSERRPEPAANEHRDKDDPLIHPRHLIDPSGETADRPRIVQYLSVAPAVAQAGGVSYCRFGCGANGCSERSDGVWLWPEGLAHYVNSHNVRLPEQFLAHMRSRDFCPLPAQEPINFFSRSSAFWLSWCASEKHASWTNLADP